jgi:H+/Cl- antiporter ClcA
VDRVHFIASTFYSDQVACGAASGVAAAFKAPIGGMLYLMELCTRWRLELTWRTFFSTSITVLSLQMLSNACSGSSMCHSLEIFLSLSGTRHAFSFASPYAQLPAMVLLAAIAGALGAAWVTLNTRIIKLRSRWRQHKPLLVLEVPCPPPFLPFRLVACFWELVLLVAQADDPRKLVSGPPLVFQALQIS